MNAMDELQNRAANWCVECFGETTAADQAERNWRFLEEALELVQSLDGNAEDAHRLVDYVFARKAGDPAQEIGGTLVTLSALASANQLGLYDNALAELRRIEQPHIMNGIRARHASKPHRSSLPGDNKHPEVP